jgi:hypothetical protein
MSIEADQALREQWPDLVAQVSGDLLTRDDLDTCARVTLRLQPDAAIGVTVTLPDGRSALRRATRRDDVLPTLQALLLVPKHPLVVTKPTALRSTSRGTRTQATARMKRRPLLSARWPAQPALEASDSLGSSSTDPGTGLGVELSLMSGARIGDGQASFGLGASSFLDLSGWLLGFAGRADEYHSLSDGPRAAALELGVLVGKRVRFPNVTLDVVAGPGVAIKGAMSDREFVAVEMRSAEPPPPPPERSSGPVPRLLVGTRLGFSPRSLVRTFVGVEGAFGPARAEGNTGAESPLLPQWTLGLALGATLGTR